MRKSILVSLVCLIWMSGLFAQTPEQETLQNRIKEIQRVIVSYEKTLGPKQDPFLDISDPNQKKLVFQTLKSHDSLLKSIYSVMLKARKKEIDYKVVEEILDGCESFLKGEDLDEHKLQSNLLALRYSLDYLESFVRAHYPSLPRNYQPRTRNTASAYYPEELSSFRNSTQKEMRLVWANFPVQYFKQRNYSRVTRSGREFQEVNLPSEPVRVGEYESTDFKMTIQTMGEKEIDLFLPPSFVPLQPLNRRVKVLARPTGGYLMTVPDDIRSVEIPLVKSSEKLSDSPYTKSIGISEDEWPSKIHDSIFEKFSKDSVKHNPLLIAKAIADFIANENKFSLTSKPETDPIAALKSGSFQSEMASFIMLGLLRDYYGIASRIAGGYRAKYLKSKGLKSTYLVLPSDVFTWVEVYHEGQWHSFDPTPTQADGNITITKNRSEYSYVPSEDAPEFVEAKISEKNLQSTPKETEKDDVPLIPLALGSIDVPAVGTSTNPLYDRALRVLLKKILDPSLTGLEIQNKLDQTASLLKSLGTPFPNILSEARDTHSRNHPNMQNWLRDIKENLRTQSIPMTYESISRLIKWIELYGRVLDKKEISNEYRNVFMSLKNIQLSLGYLSNKSTELKDQALVYDFIKNLSNVPMGIIKKDYGLKEIGANDSTSILAWDLKHNKLSDLRLLSILSPIADFISNPKPEANGFKFFGYSPQNLIKNLFAVSSNEESSRITIVLYNTSKSLTGELLRFQAGLISAYTAEALGDKGPSGKPRHKMMIIPFDEQAHRISMVSSEEEAIKVIQDYKNGMQNTRGASDLQIALMKALELIRKAQQNSKDPLATANIILMTDVASDLDSKKLEEARNKISKETPIKVMFVAIKDSNETLMKFANDAYHWTGQTGYYREFIKSDIETIVKSADQMDTEKITKTFYTDSPPRAIPQSTEDQLENAESTLKIALQQISQNQNLEEGSEPIEKFNHTVWNDRPSPPGFLKNRLEEMRKLLKKTIFTKEVRPLVVQDMMAHFETLARTPLPNLGEKEREELRNILKDAERSEDGYHAYH